MKRAPVAVAILALAAPAGALAAPPGAHRAAAPLVPRELASLSSHSHALVQLERDAGPAAEALLRAAGGTLLSEELRAWRLPSAEARRLVPQLARAGRLAEVEPDVERRPLDHMAAADPLLPRQWWLARVGADLVEPPGPGVPVTVIDSGLDLAHEEFAGRPGTQALNPQTIVAREDEFHGTAVASVLGAPANGLGVVGVYPGVVLRSWDASPVGVLRPSEVIRGLDAAAALGRGVVNLSLGGYEPLPMEQQAVLRAVGAGVLVVAAAGNDRESGSPPTYPASMEHVLTVAATDAQDRVAGFSTRSPGIDLAAPGVGIPVAAPVSLFPGGYVDVEGTSFSTPIVAGIAAWVWTVRPALDRTQLSELLRRTARDLGPPGRDDDTGFGLVDLPAALAAPAPSRDPYEPNGDIEEVQARALFAQAKPSLTVPGRGRGSVLGRIDFFEDMVDVHRVWVPPGRRVTLTLTSKNDVDLELWSPKARTVYANGALRRATLLGRSGRVAMPSREVIAWTNRGKAGVFVYADVHIRSNAPTRDALYLLRVATARAPR